MLKFQIVAVAIFLQMQLGTTCAFAQTENITRQEMLRRSVTPEREWWDMLHYHLKVEFLPLRVSINGKETKITPTEVNQTVDFSEEIKTFEINRNFYVEVEKSN